MESNRTEYFRRKIEGVDPSHIFRVERTFYVSELPLCATQTFFKIKFNVVTKPNYNMKMGRVWHAALPQLTEDHPEYKGAKYEQRLQYYDEEKKITIRGRYDCLLIVDDVVEEWKFGIREITPFDPIPAIYLAQVNAYAYLLGKKKGRLMYMHRINLTVTELNTDVDPELFQRLVYKARRVQECLDNNQIPMFESPAFDWECKGCQFTTVCPHFLILLKEKQKEEESQSTSSVGSVPQSSQPTQTEQRVSDGSANIADGKKQLTTVATLYDRMLETIKAKIDSNGGKAVAESELLEHFNQEYIGPAITQTIEKLIRAGQLYRPKEGYLMVL